MAFIETTSPEDAFGDVLAMYQRQSEKFGYLPNYARVFCHRPDVMEQWARLQTCIRQNMGRRRFELITFAAAHALGNSYCSLAHAEALQELGFTEDEILSIASGTETRVLSTQEHAMMDVARKAVRNAASTTREDFERLKRLGFTDAEIFDIVAVASARTFFGGLVDALGGQPDAAYRKTGPRLRRALSVGRPIEHENGFDAETSRDE